MPSYHLFFSLWNYIKSKEKENEVNQKKEVNQSQQF